MTILRCFGEPTILGNTHFNRKYIWTNHWFSAKHSFVFQAAAKPWQLLGFLHGGNTLCQQVSSTTLHHEILERKTFAGANQPGWMDFHGKIAWKLNPKEIPEEDFHGKIAWKLQEWHKLWFSTPMDVIWSWFKIFEAFTTLLSLNRKSPVFSWMHDRSFSPSFPPLPFSPQASPSNQQPQPHVRFLFVGLVMFWGALNHPKVERGQSEIYPKNA